MTIAFAERPLALGRRCGSGSHLYADDPYIYALQSGFRFRAKDSAARRLSSSRLDLGTSHRKVKRRRFHRIRARTLISVSTRKGFSRTVGDRKGDPTLKRVFQESSSPGETILLKIISFSATRDPAVRFLRRK